MLSDLIDGHAAVLFQICSREASSGKCHPPENGASSSHNDPLDRIRYLSENTGTAMCLEEGEGNNGCGQRFATLLKRLCDF